MKQIVAIIFLLTSIFFNLEAKAQNFVPPGGDFSALRKAGTHTVTEVINPLTVKLDDGRFIQLVGLDYPDLDFYEPGEYAVTALEILKDFLEGQKVNIYQTRSVKSGRVNRMGHHLAHIERADNNIWAQGMIISLGLARARTTQYNTEMAAQMMNIESETRTQNMGIWAQSDFSVLTPKEAEQKIGGYHLVEGRVISASRRKNMLYLNFGQNWRDDFTVGISSTHLRKFAKQNIEPQHWNGKTIRVRGWIESYNGPYMKIDHPERFEPLFETNTKE